MTEPLVCTRDTRHHIDYGIPIVANKSTDYRTITSKSHDLVPDNPQDFDCRVPINLRDDLKFKDVVLKDETFKSKTRTDFVPKYSQYRACYDYQKAPRKDKDYTRTLQEKSFGDTQIKPIAPKISEMKDNFRINYMNPNTREVNAPATTAICPIQGLGRDEQPPVRPEKKGFWKWLDPYLTTNKSTFIMYDNDQCKNAKKDFPTFYNCSGKWPGFNLPLPPASGNKTIIDPRPFKFQLPNRNLPKIVKRVPHTGITTEYSSKYQINSKSDLAPYIQACGEEFPESLSESSAWQNLAAPGMYGTEYCQIGTRRSGRNTFEIDTPKKNFIHKPECRLKFTDNYKY